MHEDAKKLIQMFRFSRFILLGLAAISLVIFLWYILTPLPPGAGNSQLPASLISPLWFWGAAGIALLVCASILLGHNRFRKIAILSFSFSVFLTVAWIRSYHTSYACWFGRLSVLPDHRYNLICAVQTGDGGICFTLKETEDWDELSEEEKKRAIPGIRMTAWRYRPQPEESYYPGWNPSYNAWKGGWLDAIGVRFWVHDKGKKGVPNSGYNLFRGVTCPYWLLLIPCLVFPAIYAATIFRRWRRTKQGFCSKCSYDLRGNTSDKCPECGQPISPRKEITSPESAKPSV